MGGGAGGDGVSWAGVVRRGAGAGPGVSVACGDGFPSCGSGGELTFDDCFIRLMTLSES